MQRREQWRFRDESEAFMFLKDSYTDWKISDDDIKQLAFLHFFGWAIADDCQTPPLKLIRGSESMIFKSTRS
ncbi:hypothetical protein D3C84_1133530 [compost metagenome]